MRKDSVLVFKIVLKFLIDGNSELCAHISNTSILPVYKTVASKKNLTHKESNQTLTESQHCSPIYQ